MSEPPIAELVSGARNGRYEVLNRLIGMSFSADASYGSMVGSLTKEEGLADALLKPFTHPNAATALHADAWPWAKLADAALAARATYSRNNLPTPGTIVRLRGLEARPELNGVLGTVTPRAKWPPNGRVLVQPEHGDTPVALKPQNIEGVADEPGPNVRTCVSSALWICHNLVLGAGRSGRLVETARVAVAARLGHVLHLLADDRRTLFGSHLLWRDVFYGLGYNVLMSVMTCGEVLQGVVVRPLAKQLLVSKHGDDLRRAVMVPLHYRPPLRTETNSLYLVHPAHAAFSSSIHCLVELVEYPRDGGLDQDPAVVALGNTPFPATGAPFIEEFPKLYVNWTTDPFIRGYTWPSGDIWRSLDWIYSGLYIGTAGDPRMVTRTVADGFVGAIKAELKGVKDPQVLFGLVNPFQIFSCIGAKKDGIHWRTSDVGCGMVVTTGALDVAVRAALVALRSQELVEMVTNLVINVCKFRSAPCTRKALVRAHPVLDNLSDLVYDRPPLAILCDALDTIVLDVGDTLALRENNSSTFAPDATATCRNCRVVVSSAKPLKCAKCGTYYCCKECQVNDWKYGFHKTECQELQANSSGGAGTKKGDSGAKRMHATNVKACYRCHEAAIENLRCSKCFTSYCSAECQKEDWEKHNHKQRCEQLQQDAAHFGDSSDYSKAFKALSEAGNATIAVRRHALAALYILKGLRAHPHDCIVTVDYRGVTTTADITTIDDWIKKASENEEIDDERLAAFIKEIDRIRKSGEEKMVVMCTGQYEDGIDLVKGVILPQLGLYWEAEELEKDKWIPSIVAKGLPFDGCPPT